ncbi:hypothetical protein, partial [uncultured Desulfovibrio sp.]|uniref:hypothetical protein n=1 Tax=uncultured Desulfovibrio sp. TaxID=167968 RepID=UPI00266F511F
QPPKRERNTCPIMRKMSRPNLIISGERRQKALFTGRQVSHAGKGAGAGAHGIFALRRSLC